MQTHTFFQALSVLRGKRHNVVSVYNRDAMEGVYGEWS